MCAADGGERAAAEQGCKHGIKRGRLLVRLVRPEWRLRGGGCGVLPPFEVLAGWLRATTIVFVGVWVDLQVSMTTR